MDRKEIIEVLDSCFWILEHDFTKDRIIELGYSKEAVEMGAKLCSYLLKKNSMKVIKIDGH